ncbi:MAG: carboxymuconolactone decarboxylase family protein [Plesiomonas sp.]
MRITPKQKPSILIKPLLWLQKKHYGEVLNPAKLWGRKPFLFWLVAGFFGYLDRKKSPLTAELRSLVCVRVSQLNNCAFCVDANGLKLAQRCNSEEKIKDLAYWQQSSLFTDLEGTVLRYVETMTITGQHVDQQLIDKLKVWFDDDALIELTALIAFQNLSAKFNSALDIPAQGLCTLSDNSTIDANQG